MHGNVCEWCQDWWIDNLSGGIALDLQGPETGSGRVIRGGSRNYWFIYYGPTFCRSAYRGNYTFDPDSGATLSGSALSWPQVRELGGRRSGPEQAGVARDAQAVPAEVTLRQEPVPHARRWEEEAPRSGRNSYQVKARCE